MRPAKRPAKDLYSISKVSGIHIYIYKKHHMSRYINK